MPDFTVALVADPEAPFERMASPEEWNRPWGERRTTRVSAAPADTLASVLERAAEQLDIRPPNEHHAKRYSARGARIAFWRPDHDEIGINGNRALMYELAVADSEGRLRFGVHDLRTVTVEQLLESARLGVIDGDPLRPYLIIEVGYGDAPPIDWPTFKAAWDVAYEVVQIVANVGGAAAVLKLSFDALRKRIKRGTKSLEANWSEWSQMSQRPDQFASLLSMHPWTADELAELLGCKKADAEGILSAFGHEPDDQDRWRPSSDPVSNAMHVIYEQANYAAHRYYDEWEETFRQRLTEYLTTGKNPGYTSGADEEDDDEVFGVGRARYELLGEKRLWMRAFCRASRPLTGPELVAAAEISGVQLHGEDDEPRAVMPSGSDATLSLDGPSLTGESLFTQERDELVDALLIVRDEERIETLRRLLDTRFTVAIGLKTSAGEPDRQAAATFMAEVAERFDGILHVDGVGLFYDGRLRLELPDY